MSNDSRFKQEDIDLIEELEDENYHTAAARMMELLKDSIFLSVLQEYGVNEWDGYEDAVAEMVYEIGG